jgi:hypothetical protein
MICIQIHRERDIYNISMTIHANRLSMDITININIIINITIYIYTYAYTDALSIYLSS